MKLLRNLNLSRKALHRHGVKTTLAMSGAAIGVASVVATVAVGRGAQQAVSDRINALGRNVLMVYPGEVEWTPTRPGTAGAPVTTLRQSDSDAILVRSDCIAAVAPVQQRDLLVKFGRLSTAATVRGTTPEYETVREFRTVSGRYFTEDENRGAERVVVLGSLVRETLFPDVDPLGLFVRIGRIPFRVIGVLESKGLSVGGGATEDDVVLIPLHTAQRRVFNLDSIKMIYVQVTDASAVAQVEVEIGELLRERHDLNRLGRDDDFVTENPRVLMAAQLDAANAFARMVVGLGGMTLVVSGVGILSLMTLSVRERRSEIGLRMAIGARRPDVRTQFLAEALVISGVGGAAGVGLGLAAAVAMGRWTEWNTVLSLSSVGWALLSALVVGGLFGVYPAHRASLWHPVTALRAE